MNNAYFGQFLNNHTWSQLQGSNPLGRKYWESPVYIGKTTQNLNMLLTQKSYDNYAYEDLQAGTYFQMAPAKYQYNRTDYPNTKRKFKKNVLNDNVYTQNQIDNIQIYKQGLNSGWFPDYSGNFLDLKERGSVTRPCSFDFSQNFLDSDPNWMDDNDRHLQSQLHTRFLYTVRNLTKNRINGNGPYARLPLCPPFAVTD